MAFHTRKYETFCLLGSPTATPLWHWKPWNAILPTIDPIISAARDRAAVRSDQYHPNQGGEVKFGRIGWNEKGHEKWTHGSPSNSPESLQWKFLSVEVWGPSWTTCGRDDLAPDVYLSIINEKLTGSADRKLSFNPVVIFAVACDLVAEKSPDIHAAVKALAKTTKAKLCGHKVRPWGNSTGVGFNNAIQDLSITGLFKPGPRHTEKVDFDLLAEKWVPYSP